MEALLNRVLKLEADLYVNRVVDDSFAAMGMPGLTEGKKQSEQDTDQSRTL